MSPLQRLNGNLSKYTFALANRFASQSSISQVTINESLYAQPDPSKPVIAITIDGCDVKHLDQALTNHMPHVRDITTPISHNKLSKGYQCAISTVFPTCSRVNQVSIMTASTPDNHGIVGDYCIGGDITDSDSLFADSICSELSHHGTTVLFMALNEEYREQLTYDLHPNSSSLSLELLHKCVNNTQSDIMDTDNALIHCILKDNEIFNRLKQLSVYFEHKNGVISDFNGECGLFLLEIMKKVLENENIETPQLSYIAISPATIQYYYDHRSPTMMQWMSQIDAYLNVFDERGCRYGMTSSHGINYKLGAKGDLFIVNIEQKLNECWQIYGNEWNMDIFSLFEYEIILQSKSKDILYGFGHIHIVQKHANENVDIELKNKLIFYTLGYMRNLKGIYCSIGHQESCSSLELPEDRIGNVLLLADVDAIFCDNNLSDLGQYEWRLSHGGLDESTVPLVLNERPTEAYLTMLGKGKGRNYHLLDILLNGYDNNLQDRCPYKHSPSQYQYIGK